MILNALEGKPLPVYGDGQQRARLALRRGPLPGHRPRARARAAPGEIYNIGGDCERTNLRRRPDDLCDVVDRLRPGSAARALLAADHLRQGPPGHDRRYAIDATQDPARAGLAAAARASRPAWRRPSLVSRQSPLGRARHLRHLSPRAARAGCEQSMPHMSAAALSQGHHPGRRLRHAALSGHPRRQQAAAAGLRQADDLLSAVDADAGRHPRHPADLHARTTSPASSGCWATAASSGISIRYAAQPQARGPGPGVPHRPRVRRRRPRGLVLGDNIFYGQGFQPMLARRPARATGRDGLRLLRSRIPSATAWSSSTRTGRAVSHRGEAGAAEIAATP